MMVNEAGRLPDGWTLSTLGEATQINPRDVSLRALPDDLPVTFLPMAAVDAWQGIIAEPQIRSLKSVRKGFTAFSDGDVLFAKITPSMENGKAAIAKNLENGFGFGSTEFHVFRPKEKVTASWIFHFIRQEQFRNDAKAHFAGTAGQLRVPASFLIDYPIPVPPLPEQERIVAKIEELFTQLDAGTSALAKVQAGLRRYKASVLTQGCEGKLVDQNTDGLPADESLLKTVNVPIDTETLPHLPDNWKWVQFSSVILKVKRGPSMKCNQEGKGIRYITSGNLEDGVVRLDYDYKFLDGFDRIDSCKLKPGDLIFNCVNSLEQIGKSAVFREAHGTAIVGFNNYGLELNTALLTSEFGNLICQTSFFKKQLYYLIKRAVNQVSFATRELDFMSIPLPPLEEQRRIVAEVERRLSVARQVENSVEEALIRASRLRQAVLRSAFEGRL